MLRISLEHELRLPLHVLPYDIAVAQRYDVRVRVSRVDHDHALRENVGGVGEHAAVRDEGGGWGVNRGKKSENS